MKYRWLYIMFLCQYCLGYTTTCHAQINNERVFDWSKTGQTIDFPSIDTFINVVDAGVDPTGNSPCDSMIHVFIQSTDSLVRSLYFPAGNYLFHNTLELSSFIEIAGDGPDKTQFIFDLNGSGHCIQAKGSKLGEVSHLSQSAMLKDLQLVLDTSTNLVAGDLIQIIPSDTSLVTSSWAIGSTGQIARIEDVQEQTIILESPLRRSFILDENHVQAEKVVLLNPIRQVYLHDLSIERKDPTTSQTSNVFFDISSECRISCIESYRSNFAHICIQNSHHIEVENTYMTDAFDFGGGGKAYGVVLQFASSECLIQNNHFERLRHAILLQAGPNGNVIAYNYSVDPFWTGTNLPDDAAGDLVLHGNYPFANLFEGNVVQNIVIDDSHGQNGPLNTFFRNRAEKYGIVMNFGIPTDQQNFIGNEITNDGFFLGNYLLFGEDHYELGNNHKGDIIPNEIVSINESSLYLEQADNYYLQMAHWPPIGIPNALDEHQIESQFKWQEQLDFCEPIQISPSQQNELEHSMTIYPNPSNGILQWNSPGINIEAIQIYSIDGLLIESKSVGTDNTLALAHLASGSYILKFRDTKHQIYPLLWIKD